MERALAPCIARRLKRTGRSPSFLDSEHPVVVFDVATERMALRLSSGTPESALNTAL